MGIVVKPQGVAGQVKIKPETDDPNRFLMLENILAQTAEGKPVKSIPIDQISVRDGFVYATLNGSINRNEAEAQRGWLLSVPRTEAIALPPDHHFIADLIGCRVVDTKGNTLGVLTDVLQPGANDVYVVDCKPGRMLIPALMKVIPTVDVEQVSSWWMNVCWTRCALRIDVPTIFPKCQR